MRLALGAWSAWNIVNAARSGPTSRTGTYAPSVPRRASLEFLRVRTLSEIAHHARAFWPPPRLVPVGLFAPQLGRAPRSRIFWSATGLAPVAPGFVARTVADLRPRPQRTCRGGAPVQEEQQNVCSLAARGVFICRLSFGHFIDISTSKPSPRCSVLRTRMTNDQRPITNN